MTKTSETIIFFGNERLATGVSTTTPTLNGLVSAGYEVAAVVINNQRTRSRSAQEPEIVNTANDLEIPVIQNKPSHELKNELAMLTPALGVLVAYGQIVSQEIIDLFPCGIINIHPSLLPKHRGPTPIESIILNGERHTGISVMKLVADMDSGPIYGQRTISVPAKITKQELANKLLSLGSEALINLLPSILHNNIVPTPQLNREATYDNKVSKKDGQVNWHRPAQVLEREVRAYAKWPKSTTVIANHQVIINTADVVDTTGTPGKYVATNQNLLVYCGKQALDIKTLQPVGKNEMPIKSFLTGYKI